VLSRSLLNRENILINFLKALASIICMCNLHVAFISKFTPGMAVDVVRPEYVYWTAANGKDVG
jgi:hypothetical protein